MFDFRQVVTDPIPEIKVVDVGAMGLPGVEESYAPLTKLGNLNVIGFEPGKEERDKLERRYGITRTFLPHVIGDGSSRAFHVCSQKMTSSTYEPHTELISLFQNLEPHMRIVSTEQVQTRRLDDVREVAGADLLKLDMQGAELDALRGAPRLLQSLLVVQTKIEFVPLYRNQPLFAEVDQALRGAGFMFHRFLGYAGRTFQPVVANNDINSPGSQMLWADAVYVRDPLKLSELSPTQLLKLAAIVHVAYRSLDLVPLILRHYDQKGKTQLEGAYLHRLRRPR